MEENIGGIKYWNDIIKSPEDNRSYRAIQLPNQMRILLISDPDTDKSAAAIDVNVGSLCDPDDVLGLAHFCEHMLFLGTEKYPEVNNFLKYVLGHGGRNNATTMLDHTMYYFDINPKYLDAALDRFSQFFISPLFTEEATTKEVNAIQAEFEKNYVKDICRIDQYNKHTAKPGHPYTKFSCGTYESLVTVPKEKGIDLREELKKFHKKWYSSNIMTLAILGKEDLDQLEKIAVSHFSDIENRNAEHLEWTDHPFGPEQFKIIGYIVPNKNIRTLSISFPSPDFDQYYRTKPYHYISNLLGHEGRGSLLSALKRRGWCDRLVSGARSGAKGFGFFFTRFDITEEGMQNVYNIVKLFFQYVKMLNVKGPQKWFFDEYQNILTAAYRFKEKEQPISYVTGLVKDMHSYPLQDVLQAHFIIDKWDPELIQSLIDFIVPSNIRLSVVAQKFEEVADQIEPWFGTRFKLVDIPEEQIQEWENCELCPELELPERNCFIPDTYDLVPREETYPHPIILHESSLMRVWYKQDDEYLVPKANLILEFLCPLSYVDPFNCNLTFLYVQLIDDDLNESTYSAQLADLGWEMKNCEYGLMLSVMGYSDKQAILLDKILESMTTLQVDPKRFEIAKENYIRTLMNFELHLPHEQSPYYLSITTSEYTWTTHELLSATSELTPEHLQAFIPQLLSKIYVECLIHGNLSKEKGLEFVSVLEKRLQTQQVQHLLPIQILRKRELQLSDGANFVYEVPHSYTKCSSIEVYFQCGRQTIENDTMVDLLLQMMSEPVFDSLRNQEQLGYVIYVTKRRTACIQGIRMIVQSQKHPIYLSQRTEAFLVRMRELLVDMDDEEFEAHKESLTQAIVEKPKKMIILSQKYWKEISLQQYYFNRSEEKVEYLKTVTKDKVLEFYDSYIKFDAPHRRKLSIHIVSQLEDGAGKLPYPDLETLNSKNDGTHKPPPFVQPSMIEDLTQFKANHGYYPLAERQVDMNTFKKI